MKTALTIWLLGFAINCALMFLIDPYRGKRDKKRTKKEASK